MRRAAVLGGCALAAVALAACGDGGYQRADEGPSSGTPPTLATATPTASATPTPTVTATPTVGPTLPTGPSGPSGASGSSGPSGPTGTPSATPSATRTPRDEGGDERNRDFGILSIGDNLVVPPVLIVPANLGGEIKFASADAKQHVITFSPPLEGLAQLVVPVAGAKKTLKGSKPQKIVVKVQGSNVAATINIGAAG